MIDYSRPSSTRPRGTITLRQGDSFNLNTGSVIRQDRTEPTTRNVPPPGTIMDSMLRRNNLDALRVFFRNNTRP